VLRVERQWTLTSELTPPKTKAGVRRIPLSDELVRFFRELRLASRYSQETDPVFASRTGGRLRHRNVQRRAFEAARDEAGLPAELRFHDMRHAFASRCASRGVPIQTLSAVMGHADVSITQRVYVALYDRARAEDAFRAAMSS
jgi:integrase